MENMDKGLPVPKWVLIVRPKIPQMPQKFSDQFVFPKFGIFEKKFSLDVRGFDLIKVIVYRQLLKFFTSI